MTGNIVVEILFDMLTYGIFLYSSLLLLSYLFIGLFSVGETRKYIHKNSFTDFRVLASSVHAPSVSILAPAYNEGMTVVENVKSLLSIYYTNLEVIVINDGSKDNSLQKLITAYDLEKIDFFVDYKIKTKPVRGVYRSRNSVHHKLIVVDKVNGGKADALNVGINISSNNYLVCIDVDCILEQDALLKMIKPFLEETDKKVIASGGVVRIANSCEIEDGKLVKVRLAKDYLPRMQILEYIRAFILGRMAWSRLNGLLIISGAFGAFDKDIAIKAGGYDHNTVGEDMELVVRMRRYMEERKEKYRITYIPDPLCWTEAPNSFNILGRQRNRWTRGTIETLRFHKVMFFNPRYGILGMLSYPYWFFFEMCAPVIEFFGFVSFFIFAALGLIEWYFFFTYLLFIVLFGYLYSAFAILIEVNTYHQYKRRTDIMLLLLTALTEPFYFHPFVVWSAIKGFIDYIRKKKAWGEMTRQGFARKCGPSAGPLPVVTEEAPVVEEPQAQPQLIEEKPQKQSYMQRKVWPAIGLTLVKAFDSFKYLVSHAVVLLLLMLIARAYELISAVVHLGKPERFNKVLLYALAKDLGFFVHICIWAIIPFALIYLFSKKLAHVALMVLAVVFVLVQLSLSQYFITTLVPLGADLWSYSLAGLRQTVTTSGGISAGVVVTMVLFCVLCITLFIFLPRRLYPNGGLATLLLLGLLAAGFRDVISVTNKMKPGPEFSNNLALNKSYFFYHSTFLYFFPPAEEMDIYSPDYADNNDLTAPFNYLDEKSYPFLHRVDSTADALSPFFLKNSSGGRPPNIVILLVEGLGSAFANRSAYLGNFTPAIDSLAGSSLYWKNFLSGGGGTFTVLPSVLGSLPVGNFTALGDAIPPHLSLLNVLAHNGYKTGFFYGGDAHDGNMDTYLRKNGIGAIHDAKTFPAGYVKLPEAVVGPQRGYGDKELFRRYFDLGQDTSAPYLNVLLTVTAHSPFLVNDQQYYYDRFDARMNELYFTAARKEQYRKYRNQYASILYTDDAVAEFIARYRQRPEFSNTVFIITGSHRMPEIPSSTKIDRYHVPLLIYSPMLQRRGEFASISTHFDIAPTLLAWLARSYHLDVPRAATWMGSGIDTSSRFRNTHTFPLMKTRNDSVDFVMGNYMLSGTELFRINEGMALEPEDNETRKYQLHAAFNRFKRMNSAFAAGKKLLPDSLLQHYAH